MMEQFFTESNIDRFLSSEMTGKSLNLEPVIKKIDFNPASIHWFMLSRTSVGGMLAMVGGTEALQPKAPFVEKMQESVIEISKSDSVKMPSS